MIIVWLAEGATEVGDGLFAMLTLLGQYDTEAHVACIHINNEGLLGICVGDHWSHRQSRAEREGYSTVIDPPEDLSFPGQQVQRGWQ